jgi:hypothetical protein
LIRGSLFCRRITLELRAAARAAKAWRFAPLCAGGIAYVRPKALPAMNIYLGTFCLALAMLALEITLTRILSVTTYYRLAFLAISTAMLIMTAAAPAIFLNPKTFLCQG